MRVTYVCADPGVPVFGTKGASIHVQEVLRAATQRGWRVVLIAARTGGPQPRDLAGVETLTLPDITRNSEAADTGARELALLQANETLAGALASVGGADLVYERHSLWSFAALEAARSAGVPAVLEVNAPLIDEQAAYRTLVHRDRAEAAARRAFAAASRIFAVSDGVADYVRARSDFHGRVSVLPNGVDTARFRPDVPPSHVAPVLPGHADQHQPTITIGFVGSLKPWHGVDLLIDAFDRFVRAHPHLPARLLMAGDGPEMPRVREELARRALASRAILTGAVAPEMVPGLLTSMDIAVAPYPASNSNYFSPLKLFEYLAAGRAIVASAIGQTRAVITHEHTGLLVPPGDTAALAAAIARLAADPVLRSALGRAGREQACREHTWEKVVDRVAAASGVSPAGHSRAAEASPCKAPLPAGVTL